MMIDFVFISKSYVYIYNKCSYVFNTEIYCDLFMIYGYKFFLEISSAMI